MTDAAATQALPRNRLILIGAFAGAAILLALCAWYFLVLQRDYAILNRDLRPSEASTIVAELEKQGVQYRLGGGGTQVLVPSGQLDATRVKLASSDAVLGGQNGFELFDASDLGLTEFAQKIRYQRALQGELARTIMMMDGVAEARVHLSMPERALFRGERQSAEAAVTLIMRRGVEASSERIDGVQRLIAAAVPDLSLADVVVLNARGEMLSAAIDALGPSARRFAPSSTDNLPSVDSALAIIRRVIPDTPFDVTVEATPPNLVGGTDGGQSGSPFIIKLKSQAPLAPAASEAIAAALTDAGMIDGASGGSILFETRFDEAASEQSSHAPPLRTEAGSSTAGFVSAATILALILALAGLGLLLWRRVLGPRLSRDERIQFATMLKSTLQTRGQEHA